MPADPALPTAEELADRLADAYRLIAQLGNRVEHLEKRLARDSSRSSKPPSSDSPYGKPERKPRDKGKRPPGKQPGEPGTTMRLIGNPKNTYWFPPAECADCGTGLAGEKVFASRRHQVTDILPAPDPEVTEYVAQSKECPCCGEVNGDPWMPDGIEPALTR